MNANSRPTIDPLIEGLKDDKHSRGSNFATPAFLCPEPLIFSVNKAALEPSHGTYSHE